LTAAGIAWLIISTGLKTALPAVFLAGLGCASIYPIYIAWLSRWYGARAKKIGGILFALGSLGGAAGPGTVGLISKLSGQRGLGEVLSLRMGMLAPLAAAVVMFGLVLLLRKQTTA
jgi:MFS family permease